MAIFRAETKSISRGKGHNLVAALSYRAGMALTDTNELNSNATTHDYTRKTDVVHREILVPGLLKKKLDDADIALDFQYIANLVETGETTQRGKMKTIARLGREWVLCGVPELSRAENIQLFQKFAKEQGDEQGVISMCFVHDPKAGNDTRSKSSAASATAKDERNIHAHIVLLTRKVELTDTNTLKLGAKSDSELSNDERTDGKICSETGKVLVKGKGLVSNSQWIKDVRKSWADMLNEKLLEKDLQPVTHKSYRELGLNIVPTIHVGNNELSQSKRVQNERINRRNESVVKSTADSITDKSIERNRENQQRVDESLRRLRLSDVFFDRVTELERKPVTAFRTTSDRVREQIAKSAADNRNRENEQRIREQDRGIAHTKSVCDRVIEFNARQARKLDVQNARAGESVSNSASDERITESKRRIDEQSRRIKILAASCERFSEFDPRRTRTTEERARKVYTREDRTREREQLIARSTSKERFYRDATAKAIACHERNLRIIASRLIFRKRDKAKYDDRQIEKLDTFYRSLDIRDFAVTTGLSREEYIQPNEWVGLVKKRLTDDKIINNPEIIAIIRNPALEQKIHLTKTSQNAPDSVEMRKTQNSSLESSKASESTIETCERPRNTFRI